MTPNFNVHGADHHWVVAQQPPLSHGQVSEIDGLFRNRWRTLLSHDDLIAGGSDVLLRYCHMGGCAGVWVTGTSRR